MSGVQTPRLSTLHALLTPHLQHSPHQTMLLQEGHTISYQQFERLVDETEQWLVQQDIKKGDRVAVWLVNRAEWLALFFALGRVGAILVAVNTKYRSHELQYILTHSQACMLIMQLNFGKIDFAAVVSGVEASLLPHLRKIAVIDADARMPEKILNRQVLAWNPAQASDHGQYNTSRDTHPPARTHTPDPESPAVFFTTSGTTKGPKLVIHSQRTLSEHARHIASGYDFSHADHKLLAALPLCGVFGLNSALGAIAAGIPIVMMDFFDVASASALIAQHHVTHIFGSDEMLRLFITHVDGKTDRPPLIPFPSLKVFGFASFSPRFIELAHALRARGFPMRGLYGSSEVQALFSLQQAHLPLEERARGGGAPAAGKELASVRARDPDSAMLCEHGVAGEIEIKSPTLFCGYYNNPDATADAFTTDGYFKTGDLGYTRPDASFVYLARMGDTMRIGGFLVDPSEIEHVLAAQPEIKSAQVVGIEIDGKLRPVAFAIATESAPPAIEPILARVGAQLAKFKVPVKLWFVQEFPATASANGLKFQRVKLREMARDRMLNEPES